MTLSLEIFLPGLFLDVHLSGRLQNAIYLSSRLNRNDAGSGLCLCLLFRHLSISIHSGAADAEKAFLFSQGLLLKCVAWLSM